MSISRGWTDPQLVRATGQGNAKLQRVLEDKGQAGEDSNRKY
jgi:hypothetical protein